MSCETFQYGQPLAGPNNLKDALLYFVAPFFIGWLITGSPGWAVLIGIGTIAVVGQFRKMTASTPWKASFDLAAAHMTSHGLDIAFSYWPRIAIDTQHRKVALVNPVVGSYDLYDFTDILGWEHTWVDKTTPIKAIGTERVLRMAYTQEDNMLVIKTNNPHTPLYKFSIGSHNNGQLWLARLSALLKG